MKNLTEVVFILDRSGSMEGLEADTIGGFNSMLEKQKKVEGDVLVSTVLFDHETQVIHDRVPLADVKHLTREDYWTRGSTALLDALGSSIQHIKKYAREEDKPDKIFLGANIDAISTASHLGINIDRAVNYHSDSIGTKAIFNGVSCFMRSFVSTPTVNDSWREVIDKDFKKRK